MPPIYLNTPGVWINEVQLVAPPIAGVSTSTAAFIGKAPKLTRFKNQPHLVTSLDQFRKDYELDDVDPDDLNLAAKDSTPLSRAVYGFFANGGQQCYVLNINPATANDVATKLELFEPIDDIAIIAAPGHDTKTVYNALSKQAEDLGDRVAICDPPPKQSDLTKLIDTAADRPNDSEYAAFYYPRVEVGPALENDPDTDFVSPSGHIAGIYARVDTSRGVHKAPANEKIRGILGLEHELTDSDQDKLNVEGVNLLRRFPGGFKVWGARTLERTNKLMRYINIRRLVNYIEESLQEGLSWAVFEPNNLPLQKQIRRAAADFLDRIWADGGLFGETAADSYYVRFPDVFNTDADRANGKLTVEIGLRVSFPAEFIIIRIGIILQSPNAA